MAGKLPYFPFYPDDWLSDEKLRACTSAARGLWIDLLCLMHKNDRRGHLEIVGQPASHAQIARMTGRTPDEVASQLQELINAGVPSALDHGILFSRRMVRDEGIRQVRSRAGSEGGKAKAAKSGKTSGEHASKTLANDVANSWQNSGSGSGSEYEQENDAQEDGGAGGRNGFESFWEAYPRHRRVKKVQAQRSWDKIAPDLDLQCLILDALERYKRTEQWLKEDGKYVPHPTSWLNARRWEDEIVPDSPQGKHHERSNGAAEPSMRYDPVRDGGKTLGSLYDAGDEDSGARADKL